jgi:hypothetical protein
MNILSISDLFIEIYFIHIKHQIALNALNCIYLVFNEFITFQLINFKVRRFLNSTSHYHPLYHKYFKNKDEKIVQVQKLVFHSKDKL